MKSRPVKRYRAILFSASKGISTLVPVTAPLKHVSADSELELTSPLVFAVFLSVWWQTLMERNFQETQWKGFLGGGRTDLERSRVTWGWTPAKTGLRDSAPVTVRDVEHMPVGWRLWGGKWGDLDTTGKAASEAVVALGLVALRPVPWRHCSEATRSRHVCTWGRPPRSYF